MLATPSLPRSSESLYPCPLTDATDKALGQLARDLVKAWGDRTLTVIELEERIATAAEKAPTEDSPDPGSSRGDFTGKD